MLAYLEEVIKVNLNDRDLALQTPLHVAAFAGNVDAVKFLIRKQVSYLATKAHFINCR